VVLFVNVFLPSDGAVRRRGRLRARVFLVVTKVALAGVGLSVVESVFAKMRLFELPDLIALPASPRRRAALRVLFQ